jgi:hypothetical protein
MCQESEEVDFGDFSFSFFFFFPPRLSASLWRLDNIQGVLSTYYLTTYLILSNKLIYILHKK